MKLKGLILSVIFLNLMLVQKSKAQNTSKTFLLPSYAIDVSFLEFRDEENNDLFIGGFHQVGIEAGKQFGKRQIGLNVRYGINLFYDRYLTDFIVSYESYWGLAINYRAQLFPKDLNENRFLKFGYRTSLVSQMYNGSKVVRNMQGNIERIDASENVYGIESGFYFNLGRDNENKGKILIYLEPIYVRITSNFFGIGVLRTGVEFRF